METEKSNKNPFFSFLAMALAVVVFATVAAHFFKNRSFGLVGTTAPPIQIDQWITSPPPDLDGRVYVLEFWATWCPPCIQSIPHTIELADKYKDKAPFIAISVDRSSEPVKKMVSSKGINYYVGMDSGLSGQYSVRSIPATFIIGRNGQIVWQGHPVKPDFESALTDALNAPPEPQTNSE